MKLTRTTGLIALLCALLLPALALAAPPTPKGKLVFEDDFSSNKSGLADQLTATDYSRGFHAPGVYHLKDLKPNTTNWELFPNQSYGQFAFQTDVWDNSDNTSAGDLSGGVVFRATDKNHFYAVLIDPRKGQYAIRKLDGASKWSDLVAATASPLVKRKAEVNQVRVDGEGSTFTIYLNGEKLADFSDSSFAKGSIGFIASNVDAVGNHTHFDNVKVWSGEAATAGGSTPGNLPGTGTAGDTAPLAAFVTFALLLLAAGAWLRRVVA